MRIIFSICWLVFCLSGYGQGSSWMAAGMSQQFQAASTSTLGNGLIFWAKLNEGTGTAVADSSGNGNNGTVTGAAWTTLNGANALRFDTSGNDYVIFPTSSNVCDNLSNFTTSFWFITTNISTSGGCFVSKVRSLYSDSYGWAWINTDYDTYPMSGKIEGGCATGQSAFDSPSICSYTVKTFTNAVHLFVGSVSNALGTIGRSYLYIDGTNATTTYNVTGLSTNSYSSWTNYIVIGGSCGDADYRLQATSIADVRIWNRQLTASEITQLYSGGTK